LLDSHSQLLNTKEAFFPSPFLPECMDVCSRECAAPESSFIAREFGVVVKVSILQSPVLDGSDGGSGPVGPQIFFLEKKLLEKESRVTSLPSPFPQKSLRIVVSLAFETE